VHSFFGFAAASAHLWNINMLAGIMSCSSDGSLILVAGDSGSACRRFNDTWQLQLQLPLQPTGQVPAAQSVHWKQWQQEQEQQAASVATCCPGYTARSNAAATVAGDWLVLVGGWDESGAPLLPLLWLQLMQLCQAMHGVVARLAWCMGSS
jgi:hypothetical protein